MPEGEVMSEVSRKMGVNLHEMGTSSHLGAIRSAEQQWYDSMQPGEGDPGTTYTFETVNLGPGMQTNILVEKPNFLVPESEEDGAPPTLEERILGTDWNQVEMDNLAANGKLPEKGKIVYYPSGEKGIVTFSYDGAVEVTTKRGTIRFSLESDDPGHEFWMKFRDPGTEHSIEMDRLRNQWATENGMTGEELGRTSASIGVGLIPIIGTLQSAVELVSGRDYITGEKVHRGIAAAGLLLGLVPGGKGALKFATKVYQKGGFKLLAKAGPRLMKKLAQVSGPGALKGVDKLDDAARSGTGLADDAAEVISGSRIEHLNGAIGEAHGYAHALDDLGHISIKSPGKVTTPGLDFATYSPDERLIYLWDAKYRSAGTGYPSSVSLQKLPKWTQELMEHVDSMPNSQLRTELLQAIQGQRIKGSIFRWPPR